MRVAPLPLFTTLVLSGTVLVYASDLTPAHGHGLQAQAKRHAAAAHGNASASTSTPTPGRAKRAYSGQFTWFDDGLGACGKTNVPSDFIVALNSDQYGSGEHCFAMITVSWQGKSAQAQITDECPGCGTNGLDFSKGLFEHFADTGVGVLEGSWDYDDAPAPAPAAAAAAKPADTTKDADAKPADTATSAGDGGKDTGTDTDTGKGTGKDDGGSSSAASSSSTTTRRSAARTSTSTSASASTSTSTSTAAKTTSAKTAHGPTETAPAAGDTLAQLTKAFMQMNNLIVAAAAVAQPVSG